ncbi:nuclear receptor coactivator 6-like isoform X1 [Arapaima gigas]
MRAVVPLAALAAFFSSIVLSLDPVPIQFQTDPVLVATGGQAVITLVTISNVLSISWISPGGAALGVWVPSGAVVSSGGQYSGRIQITSTQLQISSVQLMDAGNYTVTVVPSGTTGLGQNLRSVEMRVYDAVNGVNLFVPTVALEGGNISLTCTWTQGTQTSVIWTKSGTPITSDSRVTISAGSLVIYPGNRNDRGVYSCTVSNPVSAKMATANLTVYYGPDTPTLQLDAQTNCVGGGQAVAGQTVKLTCSSASLPPALFSWQQNGQSVTGGQSSGGVLTLQSISSSQSGQYVCVASNAITTKTAQKEIGLTVVGTCLSAGAVAGIVIGSVLSIILIIIAIVLLLCWKKGTHGPRQDTRLPNTSENPQLRTPAVQTAPTEEPARGPRPDPPLYDPIPTVALRQRQAYVLQNGRRGTGTLQQNGLQSPNASGSGGSSSRADQRLVNGAAFVPSDQHNLNKLQQPRNPHPAVKPAGPSILIQTGQTQSGSFPPAIHVTLNTVPPGEQHNNTAQPQTVHLNVNAYPSQQNAHQLQNENTVEQVNQLNDTLSPNHNHHSPHSFQSQGPPAIGSDARPGQATLLTVAQDGVAAHTSGVEPSAQIQTDSTQPANRTGTGQRNANTQTYWSNPGPGQSVPSARHTTALRESRQLPWDNPFGTPHYPNRASGSGDSSDSHSEDSASSESHGVPRQNTTPLSRRAGQVVTQSPVRTTVRDPIRHTVMPQVQTQPRPRVQQPNLLTVLAPQSHGNAGGVPAQNLPSQQQRAPQKSSAPVAASQDPVRQPPPHSHNQIRASQPGPANPDLTVTSQRPVTRSKNDKVHSATQNPDSQRQNPDDQADTMTHRPGGQQQASPQTANNKAKLTAENPSALTQAALQKHTAQIHNPFQNRNEQTRAALAQQDQQPHPRPPTPPPVIRLTQFQGLPKQRLPETRPWQPPAALRPVVRVHPNDHHNAHRLPGHVHPNAHHNAHHLQGHVHPNMQRHPHTHRDLAKQRQAPGGMPKR